MWLPNEQGGLGVPLVEVVEETMAILIVVSTPPHANPRNSQDYPPFAPHEQPNYYPNNGGFSPYPRDLGYGSSSHYTHDTQYALRSEYPNRHDIPFRHFDSNNSYERRDEVEFNVSTSNQFYPLCDLKGPYENSASGVGLVNPPHSLKPSTGDNFASPGPSSHTQHWGFHKLPQGIKRPKDQKEGPEEGENYELKRKKS